jgi:Tfp pilus assembly protein PilF
MSEFAMAIELNPREATGHFNLGLSLAHEARAEKAADHFREAVRLRPDWAVGHDQLGIALCLLGRPQEAANSFERAINLQKNVGKFYYDLAHAYMTQGNTELAAKYYERGQGLDPNFLPVSNQGAWELATQPGANFRSGALALRSAKQICEATNYQQSDYLDTLAAAYAETGQFDLAAQTARQALAATTARPDQIPAMQSRLKLYEAGKPYRAAGKGKTWDTGH